MEETEEPAEATEAFPKPATPASTKATEGSGLLHKGIPGVIAVTQES